MDHLHKFLQDTHYQAQFLQQGKPQQKTNTIPNPSTGQFLEGAGVVILYIKGLSEQYMDILAKPKLKFFL